MLTLMYGTETENGRPALHTAAFANEDAGEAVKARVGRGDNRASALADLWDRAARGPLTPEEKAEAYHSIKAAASRLRNDLAREGAGAA